MIPADELFDADAEETDETSAAAALVQAAGDVVLPDGSIADGRPAETVGAHALGVNTHSLGIVIVGDFEKRRPDERQLQSLLQVTRQMMVKYDLPAAKVVPHREATQGTSCPGAQFPWAEFCLRLKNMR